MADKVSNKVLYIDNITTYDYVKNYVNDHTVNPNNSKFTYVVFTDYERPNNYGVSYHGDIFFNGHKITYINDVNVNAVVSDGLDNFIGYVNSNQALDFARSTIRISRENDPMGLNKYELFNVTSADSEVSYEYISNIGNYTIEEPGTWSYAVIYGDAIVNDGTIKNNKSDKSCVVHLSYTFVTGDENHRQTNVSYAYYSVYNVTYPTSVDFGYTPKSFTYKDIYTPLMNIEPWDAAQSMLTFTSDSECVKILNKRTGTFLCSYPGRATITCSYMGSAREEFVVSYVIDVNKVNPNLGISAFGTTYLWNDDEYKSTCCYAHYNDYGFPTNGCEWKLEPNGITFNGTNIQSAPISYSDLNPNTLNKIKFSLPESYFYPSYSYIQLYAPDQTIAQTKSITITNFEVHETDSIQPYATFVVVACADVPSNVQEAFVDTNYIYNNSLGFDSFTTVDITHDGTYTYTYMSVYIEPNHLNDIYAEYITSYNEEHSIETDDTITCYNIINVNTSDSSFVNGNLIQPYQVDTTIYKKTDLTAQTP